MEESKEGETATKSAAATAAAEAADKVKGALVDAETKAVGGFSRDVYLYYIKALGGLGAAWLIVTLIVVAEVGRVSSSFWMGKWSDGSMPGHAVTYYLGVYAGLAGVQAVCLLSYTLLSAYQGLAAGRVLHKRVLASLLRAPMGFFDRTPTGRLINIFSSDQPDVDKWLIFYIVWFGRCIVKVVGTATVLAMSTYYSLIAFVPLGWAFTWCQRAYQCCARELKRFDAVTKSPIFAHFDQCVNGVSTIRAYRTIDHRLSHSAVLVDNHVRLNLAQFSSNRWLALRIEMLGGVVVVMVALFCVMMRTTLGPMVVGLALSYALQITGTLNPAVRLSAAAENGFNSVERIKKYSDLAPEAPDDLPPVTGADADWPAEGAVEFKDVVARYRADLPPVLNHLTFSVKPREKIGIVGRTGAGKSTLFLVIFRLLELGAFGGPGSGQIKVDGVDISRLGLRQLRSKLTIVPQDPVLFIGSVRFNLDPFSHCSDAELWAALDKTQLQAKVSKGGGLGMLVEEGGVNFSVGERQLLCVARALLRRSRVLLLDEATASIDTNADRLLQGTITAAFQDCTLLIIAHRLDNIMGCDRILVMDSGRVLEFDQPAKLLRDPSSRLSAMVVDAGDKADELRKTAFANEKDGQ